MSAGAMQEAMRVLFDVKNAYLFGSGYLLKENVAAAEREFSYSNLRSAARLVLFEIGAEIARITVSGAQSIPLKIESMLADWWLEVAAEFQDYDAKWKAARAELAKLEVKPKAMVTP